MLKDSILAACVKTCLYPFRLLPHKNLHQIGRGVGRLLYHLIPTYRKRALSNLSLAKDLNLSEEALIKIAKESFENLAITCLEYAKFAHTKNISNHVICQNPKVAEKLIKEKQGVIFFCGHQSNWEVLFLDGTKRMPGVAIGRPIKNRFLYTWIIKIRERFGGKIVSPNNALKEGIRALKQGKFLGIVGDQGMPLGGHLSTFLGRAAWTSPAPALLAYKTNCPIIVATTKRKDHKYYIHYSDPIWPDLNQPLEQQVNSLMDQTLKLFEQSILESPGEWLWQHNRWKQESAKNVFYKYRHDSILIILPQNPDEAQKIANDIKVFREIYPQAFLTVAAPFGCKLDAQSLNFEIWNYASYMDLYKRAYAFKLIFNFSEEKHLKQHFLKLSAFLVLSLEDLRKEASFRIKNPKDAPLEQLLKKSICREEVSWEANAT
jgi:KDO2-lipid IV(A) lauroyltransferase